MLYFKFSKYSSEIQNYIVKVNPSPSYTLLSPLPIWGGKYFIPAATIGGGPVTGDDFILQLSVAV